MKKVLVEKVASAPAGADAQALPARVREALGELAGAAQEGLLQLSVGVGLGVLCELIEEEVDDRVRPAHLAEREALAEGEMALRWTAAGMLEAERQFRKIIGYRDLAKLATAVEREVAQTVTPTPTKETPIPATV